MTRVTRPAERTLTEWVVLGLLAEGPAHGFELSKPLAPGGAIGRVWSASRPLTYRALEQLTAAGLAVADRVEPGAGPRRTIHKITPVGRRALRRWLATPVDRIRKVRAELLVKLLLLERAGVDTGPLLAAQRAALEPGLSAAIEATEPDSVTRWRREQALAVDRFLRGG
jgi:DNA-binding PadR family transcriptional regulator